MRLLGFAALAALVAAVLQVLVSGGIVLWLSIRDGVGVTSLWQNPLEFREFYVILVATTATWAILPRILLRIRPSELSN